MARATSSCAGVRHAFRPGVEQLESRLVPYSVSGGSWLHPELITISFVPDGTRLSEGPQGAVHSTMFADFNARFGSPAAWQGTILRAAQAFARQTNINFSVVPDDGSPLGFLGPYQQGDPNYGDIRIGGGHFTGFTFLAGAHGPQPQNNFSIAGDFYFNTDYTFSNGGGWDLFTIAAHEFGHALGLHHSEIASAVMAATYPGAKTDLAADDVAGIRSIYSAGQPRTPDAYDVGANNDAFSRATLVPIDVATKTALFSNLDITTSTDNDFFKIVVPANTDGTLTVTVQSAGLSLLAPKVYLYNSWFQQRGFANGAGQYGTTLTLTLSNVSAGQVYYVRVMGADASAFGTGRYALVVNAGAGPSPLVPLPDTRTLNGDPLQSGGGEAFGPGCHTDYYYGDDDDDFDRPRGDNAKPDSDGPDKREAADRVPDEQLDALVKLFWETFGSSFTEETNRNGLNQLFERLRLL